VVCLSVCLFVCLSVTDRQTDHATSSVLSVSQSVMIVSPAKMTELIEMPFRMWIQTVPSNCELNGVQILPREGAIFREKRGRQL